MDKKTLGLALLDIVCCGLILAAAIGGWAFLARNWWVLIGAGILIIVSIILMRKDHSRAR
jgi:hypothetical protein